MWCNTCKRHVLHHISCITSCWLYCNTSVVLHLLCTLRQGPYMVALHASAASHSRWTLSPYRSCSNVFTCMRPLINIAHVPAGLLHLHALSLRFHTARVHTHATCARWLENSPLTIACRASPMPGRCVHACLARLLMSSLSCIPAFSPNVVCVQDSIFCAILHVINLYKYCKNWCGVKTDVV